MIQTSGNFFNIVASNLDSKLFQLLKIIIPTAIIIIIAWQISILSSFNSSECLHILITSIGNTFFSFESVSNIVISILVINI